MRPTRSKVKVFALGLASWSIPCVAFAIGVPAPSLRSADIVPTFAGELVLAPMMGDTAGTSTGDWLVQVGAYADRSMAQARLKAVAALVARYGLDDAQFVEPHVDDDMRTLYRAQFIGLTESAARSLCNSLSAVSESCFVSRASGLNSNQLSGSIASSALLTTQEGLPQSSSTSSDLTLASARPIGDDELENARGGFSINGINFNFGASVQTLVNGQLALQTNLQWTSTGAVVTQVQGLGTKIVTQVDSTLANAGIIVPTTNSTTPLSATASNVAPTVTVTPAATGISNTPQTGNTPTVVASVQTPTSGATSLTGGTITPLSGNTSPTTVSSSPASTTTIPVSFVGVSPTTSSSGPTSSPLTPSISFTGLQSNSTSAPATPSTPPLTVNSLVTTTATTPSSVGSDALASNSPASSSTNSPNAMTGVQIQSSTGTTEVFANVSNGQIQNVILNTASNQNIVQNTSMVLTIYNFSSWQQLLAQHAMSAQLANQVLAASGFIGGR